MKFFLPKLTFHHHLHNIYIAPLIYEDEHILVTSLWADIRWPVRTTKSRLPHKQSPSIETHLAVVRGLPGKKFQTESVNEKRSAERRS